ncbi:unnamed protein product [Durusdinium trenchii]|uniref:ubiquitinyl hydrolase 1 n=1 Tax=Durusdinium trenchii TaxID=1381693 RepID=A0ABP0HX79_9DINO
MQALSSAWQEAVETVPAALKALRCLAELCESQEEHLVREQLRVQKELSEAYESHGLQKEGYELYAIWVHQGEARSGHYLAFLRDWRQDRWVRFSDSFVSIVTWEEVQTVALGGTSRSSAYVSLAVLSDIFVASLPSVLVYMEASLVKLEAASEEGEIDLIALPSLVSLLKEINVDNQLLEDERGSWEEQLKGRELKHHAQAIFQHYAGLLHTWEPQKHRGDSGGNPHDASHRKILNDPALISLELYLYRQGGEQDVWHYLLKRSLDAQREIRAWQSEDEGRILFFLAETMRSQSCYVKMLQEKTPSASPEPMGDEKDDVKPRSEYELIDLDLQELRDRYSDVLRQAYMLDEALDLLKKEGGLALARSIGLLSLLWAHYNLDTDYRFRHNEVLLVLSSLMFNTVSSIELLNASTQAAFRELCEYFYIVLHCVEWPKGWKLPLQNRIKTMFPHAQSLLDAEMAQVLKERAEKEGAPGVTPMINSADQKQLVRQRSLMHLDGKSVDDFREHPPAGEAFFERHRSLWLWTMSNEKVLAQEFVNLASGT